MKPLQGMDGLLTARPPVGVFQTVGQQDARNRPYLVSAPDPTGLDSGAFANGEGAAAVPPVTCTPVLTHRSVSEYLICLAAAGFIVYYAPGKWKLAAIAPAWWGLAGLGWAPSVDLGAVAGLIPAALSGLSGLGIGGRR